MKKLILPILLALSLSSYSQYSQHPKVIDTPTAELNLPSNRVIRFVESPTLETKPDLRLELAGKHLEKAGKQKNESIFVAFSGMAIAGLIILQDTEETDNVPMAIGIAGAAGLISLSLNISANTHIKKSGQILQGK